MVFTQKENDGNHSWFSKGKTTFRTLIFPDIYDRSEMNTVMKFWSDVDSFELLQWCYIYILEGKINLLF